VQPTAPAQDKGKSEANGIVQIIDEAMSAVTLRPDQSAALGKLGSEEDSKVAAVDQAKRDFLLTLADEIAANQVDATAMEPKTKAFVDADVAASPEVRAGLEKLHDSLDPQQRKQFVSGLRDALKRRATLLDPKSSLDKWSKTLNLTDDQKSKIQAIMAENTVANDVAKARLELVLAAFPGDTFSMDDLLPAAAVGHRAEHMAKRIIDVAAKVTPILTPEQRTAAADKIRSDVSGGSTRASGTGTATSSEGEEEGIVSEELWAGRAGYAAGYRSYSGAAFSSGYAGGFGGTYLF
jgi:Spy/CpxP family protein refolding chaperone